MSNYESVKIKGLANYLYEPPTIEFERFSSGRIQFTKGRSTFDITKEQAAELGAKLLRWGRG